MKPKVINTLSVRLIISLSSILIILLSVYTYFILNNLNNHLTESRFQTSYNLSEIIKKSTRYGMLLNRPEDVHAIINTLRSLKGVEEIRIYNKQGTISYSTNPAEILNKVDLNAEACIGCHNSSVPLQDLKKQDKIRVYKNSEIKRVLGLINPIMNEPDCSNAACHAHPQSVNILGVLDVGVSLEGLDAIIQKSTTNVILASIFLVIVISFFSGLFITILVNRPIKIIREGIEAVGNGDLDYKIQIHTKNELGQVARRFNEMSTNLAEAYKEIKNWSETLNDKVNEKTEELKNIYNQVNQIEKLASLGKLSATVAHELNNPLAGILTYSKLITKKLQASNNNSEHATIIEYLELISHEAARCGQIVKDLLIFSHSEKDQFAKENLLKIIYHSITVINHHLEINGITLVKDYGDSPIYIYCNANKIQQALISLLINSIEAMPNGGNITINVTTENNNIVLRITDEGTGIADKDLSHIFVPFYSTKAESSGTGLGLAVAYGIITNHNGKIEVEKTSHYGTTFKIELPQNEQQA
ncbi:MAG TPA: HAMP domain-containing sensor histidine kinase [Ignavibacteriaceae bacterium]|nr:HAMP domain-containing sensor histidine kinase [Ignavibacteriaceae bacterium]